MNYKLFVVLSLVYLTSNVFGSPVDEKKPFDCPENEEYYKCSLVACYKLCQHLKTPPACPMIAADCYKPACVCKDGFLRHENGVCVPTEKCFTSSYAALG